MTEPPLPTWLKIPKILITLDEEISYLIVREHYRNVERLFPLIQKSEIVSIFSVLEVCHFRAELKENRFVSILIIICFIFMAIHQN